MTKWSKNLQSHTQKFIWTWRNSRGAIRMVKETQKKVQGGPASKPSKQHRKCATTSPYPLRQSQKNNLKIRQEHSTHNTHTYILPRSQTLPNHEEQSRARAGLLPPSSSILTRAQLCHSLAIAESRNTSSWEPQTKDTNQQELATPWGEGKIRYHRLHLRAYIDQKMIPFIKMKPSIH